jgi:pSer/pThr/pTyr-binding forkhead associated (FHA) protein
MASLTITKGSQEQVGKQFIVKHRPLAGGRHPSQEIQLLDPEVSRRHFLIRVEGDDHLISESQSANGVYVNDQKVKEHKLQHGDQIRVGATVLVYSRQDSANRTDEVQHQRRGERPLRERATLLQDPDPPAAGHPSS